MYPLPQTPLPCTSGFIPGPSSTFQPITPAAPSPAAGEVATKPFHAQQNKKTSPSSSLQCGRGTPTAPTDSQTPVQLEGNSTHQGTHKNNLPAQTQQQNAVPHQQSPLPQP